MTIETKQKPRRIFRPQIHWQIKQEIWGMACAACLRESKHIQIDHIIPVKQGGSSERDNLQPLCRWCNGVKGGRMMTNAEILEKMRGRL